MKLSGKILGLAMPLLAVAVLSTSACTRSEDKTDAGGGGPAGMAPPTPTTPSTDGTTGTTTPVAPPTDPSKPAQPSAGAGAKPSTATDSHGH